MANTYRISRNLEASFIDYLKTKLQTDWSISNVEKSFARIYDVELPSICIRVGETIHTKAELGDDSTIRDVHVLIDLFCTSDGQRLDLKDYIIEKIKNGIDYYEYEIDNGAVTDKTKNGRIRVLNIGETLVNFEVEKNELDVHDRYRHLIDLTISLGRIES